MSSTMAFTVQETAFPVHTLHSHSLFEKSNTLEELPKTPLERSNSNDELEQERAKSINSKTYSGNSSLHSVSALTCQHQASTDALKSFHSCFFQIQGSEQGLKKNNYQEQYWACAIPESPPPCPDRASPHWDPNKEYQDLLDYTYPLNPKYFICKDSEESDIDPLFSDSGIDLDSYNISGHSKLRSVNLPHHELTELKTRRQSRLNHMSSPCAYSTPLIKKSTNQYWTNQSGSSHEASFEEISPFASKVHKETNPSIYENTYNKKIQNSGQFIPTTKILHLNPELEGDEEFLSLPPHLKEIENLATHLQDLSLNVSQNWVMSPRNVQDESQQWFSFKCRQGEAVKGIDKREEAESLNYSHSSYPPLDLTGSKMNTMDHCKPWTSLNKFFSLRDMLDGAGSSYSLETDGFPSVSNIQGSPTLVQIIQAFCHHLDKLIQWLYSFSELKYNWTDPKPDVESIQLSLSLYKKFKTKISEHQTLADTVIKDGELLLKYFSLNSSVLKDTLLLISKQSKELEGHAECLYASVLKAMETITDDSLGKTSNLKQHVSLEMASS